MAEIREAKTDREVRACFAVLNQLRPHLKDESALVKRFKTQAAEGYRIVYAIQDREVRAVAGFRVFHMLYQSPTGRFLYVDDLITDESKRSSGLGASLLEWLLAEARRLECDAVELDSGVQRVGAHRFYLGQGMHISSYHFRIPLKGPPPRVLFQAGPRRRR